MICGVGMVEVCCGIDGSNNDCGMLGVVVVDRKGLGTILCDCSCDDGSKFGRNLAF